MTAMDAMAPLLPLWIVLAIVCSRGLVESYSVSYYSPSAATCEKPPYDAVVSANYAYFYNPALRSCYRHDSSEYFGTYKRGFETLYKCEQQCRRYADGSCMWKECRLDGHRAEVRRLRDAMNTAATHYRDAQSALRDVTKARDDSQKATQAQRAAVSRADVTKALARAKVTSENARMRSPGARRQYSPGSGWKTVAEENYECAVATRDLLWRQYLDMKGAHDYTVKTIPEATRSVTQAHLDYLSAKRDYDKAYAASRAAGNAY